MHLPTMPGTNSVRAYFEDFNLIAADLDWNEPTLRKQFKKRLNKAIIIQLIQQGISHSLQDLYVAAITAESQVTEVRAFFSSPDSCFQSYLLLSLPQASLSLDLDTEEPMQIGAARQALGAEEWQRNRELTLCFCCRDPSYMVNNCPTKTSQKKKQAAHQCLHYSSPGQ